MTPAAASNPIGSMSGGAYSIARPTGRCAATGEVIAAGETYIATLCEQAAEAGNGFERHDFGVTAWNSGRRPERLFSFWRAKMPEASQSAKPFVDDDVLINLFHRLEGETEARRLAYRFVITLILVRKKHLAVTATNMEAGVSTWLVRFRGDPPETPAMAVVDPGLDETNVREVADQLGEILRGEL